MFDALDIVGRILKGENIENIKNDIINIIGNAKFTGSNKKYLNSYPPFINYKKNIGPKDAIKVLNTIYKMYQENIGKLPKI